MTQGIKERFNFGFKFDDNEVIPLAPFDTG